MNIWVKFSRIVRVIALILYLIPSCFAADKTQKFLRVHAKKNGTSKTVGTTNTKPSTPYSVSQPYNPNNPPPLGNKVHPVSSNAH